MAAADASAAVAAASVPPPARASTVIPAPRRSGLLARAVAVDISLSLQIYDFFRPYTPHFLLKTLEISGDGRAWFPLVVSLLPLSSPRAAPFLLALLAGLLLDLIFIGIFKNLVRRPRPVYNKGMSLVFAVDHWSFPSGHSSRAALVAAIIVIYAELAGFAFVATIIWASVTAISRVLLGRHFVLDVFAGVCLGVIEALIVLHCLDGQVLYDYMPKKLFLAS